MAECGQGGGTKNVVAVAVEVRAHVPVQLRSTARFDLRRVLMATATWKTLAIFGSPVFRATRLLFAASSLPLSLHNPFAIRTRLEPRLSRYTNIAVHFS